MLSSLAFGPIALLLAGIWPSGDHEPGVEGLVVAPGLAATLWAESPMLYNPTAIDVDARGRVWVAEAVNYRQWNGRNPGRTHPEGDRIVVLEDTDGDGRADTSTVFAQDLDLTSPLGIAVIGERVYVSCSPSLFVYVDEDGDDVADSKHTLLTGFGGPNHDHGLHSVVCGPDGRLLFNVGNAGPHLVTDRSGWSLRSGSLYNGGGPELADNRPGLVSDDGRAWTGGLVLRMGPDGGGLEVLAHNFRNPYEVAVDSFGDIWQTDNDDDGNQGCRAVWILEGGNYGFFSADGARSWQADRRPGQATQRAHWHQDDPGVTPTTVITGSGGPTGVTVYEGDLIPGQRGHVLAADAGRNRVFSLTPRPDGAGMSLAVDDLVSAAPGDGAGEGASDARDHWFRPSDVAVGPDGSIFVADWYDPGVGGHQAGDREAWGRIVRLAPPGHAPVAPAVELDTLAGAAHALASPALAVRALGASALRRRGDEALPGLLALYDGDDAITAARAAWLLAELDPGRDRLRRSVTEDPDPRRRLVAARALAAAGESPASLAEALMQTDAPGLLREAALLLQDAPAEAAPLRARLVARYAGDDRVLLEALGAMLEAHPAELPDVIASMLAADPSRWSPATAELAWRLHDPALVGAWAARAMAPGLTPADREQALAALAFTPSRSAADAVLTAALAGPDDTRELAAFWVRHRDGNDWAAYDLAQHLGFDAWSADALRFDSGPVERGELAVDVDITGARHLGLVITESDNGKSCDWADWLAPTLSGPAGELSLAEAPWVSATTGWGAVQRGRNCEGGPLSVDGVVYADGIGAHAPSEILFAVPEGYTRLAVRAAVDDGGSRQPGATTRVEFKVFADRPAETGRLAQERALVLDADADDEAREEAAERLAGDAEGGLWLATLAASGELDPDLTEVVSESIFSNPDFAVRALASEHFQRPGTAVDLPPLAELARLPGDARRGRRLFVDDATGCHRCHSRDGRGGDVGPDLSAIHAKYGALELLDAMLDPSAAIAFGYDAWTFRLADGRVLGGLLLADGERLLVKDGQGERHVLERDEVVDRWRNERSLMPDNAALGLSVQDLADLTAFLLEDRSIEPTLGAAIPLLVPGSLDGWRWYTDDAGVPVDDVWRWDADVLVCRGTPIGYLRTEATYESFELEFDWRFPAQGAPGNSGVLLRLVGDDEIWPRSIEAQLHHRDAGDIWNIGRFDMLTDPLRTNGRRTLKLKPSSERPVGEWNHCRIRLDGPDLTLEVNGVVQNEARWCEQLPGFIALQSEGAEIQFRDVRLRPLAR